MLYLYLYLLHFSQYITYAAVKVGGADFVSSRCLKEREVADHRVACMSLLSARESEIEDR